LFVLLVPPAIYLSLYVGLMSYRIVRWKAYIWVPSYLRSSNPDPPVPDDQKHLIFVMVDHYEHGGPKKLVQGAKANEAWLRAFRPIADRHRDSYGNKFRYTWFYPYDHRNERILVSLCRMAYDGYGEVELHWHHPLADSTTFPQMLKEAIAWFQRHGALISSGPKPETHFAFIHGNWCLDNSDPGRTCGVNRELDILFRHGCYADFTFSTIGTVAQPRKINSIYYATDTDEPKSYDDGVDVEVGKPVNDRLMIFEGPIAVDWSSAGFEYGAVGDGLPSPRRIDQWIGANVHVKGRPEWVFVKVYTHGAQVGKAIMGNHLDPMLRLLKETCDGRGMRLHYMTAREAYNVVKAAEDRKTGNPEDYRDYRISKPRNMVVPVSLSDAAKPAVASEKRPARPAMAGVR
jgi:hypothetical protein